MPLNTENEKFDLFSSFSKIDQETEEEETPPKFDLFSSFSRVDQETEEETPPKFDLFSSFSKLEPEEPEIPKSRRDNAWSFGVDQAQKLAGKGVEVFGDHFDIDFLENLGREYVADQEQDIKEGGYKPEYTGSWTDSVKEGTGIGWFGEKFAENAAQGGVALVGGATTAIVGAFSAPAALVVGTGVSVGTLGLTWAMGIGEVAQEMEDKGVELDTGLAVGTGALIALLDKFGAGKVISKSEIARATGSELVEKLVGAGFKDAAGAVAKTIVKKAGIEAGTEALQEGSVVGASAIKGAKYTADELVDRAIDSAILGGSMGASFGSVDVGKDVFTSRSLESDLRTQMDERIKENGVTYNQETGEYSTPVDVGNDFYQRNLAPEIIRPESKFVNPEDHLRTGVEGLIAREQELSASISEDEGSELQYERDLINSKLTEVLSQEKPVELNLSGRERLLTAIEDVPVDRELQQEQLAIREAREQAEKDAQSVTQGTVPIDSLGSSSFEGGAPLETGGSSVQLSITASEGEGGVDKDLTGGTPRKFTPEGETYSVPDSGGSGYPTPRPTEFAGTTPETIGDNNQAVMPFSFKTGVQGVNQEYSPPDRQTPTPKPTPESPSPEGFSASGGQETAGLGKRLTQPLLKGGFILNLDRNEIGRVTKNEEGKYAFNPVPRKINAHGMNFESMSFNTLAESKTYFRNISPDELVSRNIATKGEVAVPEKSKHSPADNLYKVRTSDTLSRAIRRLGGLKKDGEDGAIKEGFTDPNPMFNNGGNARTFGDMAKVLEADYGFDLDGGSGVELVNAITKDINETDPSKRVYSRWYKVEGKDEPIDPNEGNPDNTFSKQSKAYPEGQLDYVGNNEPLKKHIEYVHVDDLISLEGYGVPYDDKMWASLKDDITKAGGLEEPVQLNIDRITRTVQVDEGNHRVRAAKELGYEYVPVVANMSSDSTLKHKRLDIIPSADNAVFHPSHDASGKVRTEWKPTQGKPSDYLGSLRTRTSTTFRDSDDFLSSYTVKDIKDKDKRLDTLAKEKSAEDTKFDVDQELRDNNYEMELTPNLGEEQSTYKPAQTDLFVTTRGEAEKSAEVTPFRKDTGLTDIDDMFNKPHLKEYFRDEKHKEAYQIEVTPDAYLDALRSTDFDIDNSISQTRVDEYADRMLKGDKFPALLYDIHRGFISQEGRHRALAAKKIGVKSLPVSVVYETGKVDKVPSELSAVSKESTKPTESKTGNTVEALSQSIAKNFRRAGKMMGSDSLIVVQSTDELSAELKARADALHSALISGDISGTEGLYEPVTKKTYLVADMISDKNMKSVFLHEMLHKGYAENPKIRSAINSDKGGLRDVFNNAEKGKFVGKDANIYKEAMKRVDFAKTTANDRFEEFIAYSVSMYNTNPKSLSDKLHKLVKDLIAKVRQLGMSMGIEWSNLTPADLNQMAISAINYDKAKAATSSIRSAVKAMPHDDEDKVVPSPSVRLNAKENFDKWAGGLPVLESHEVNGHDFQEGEGVVMKVKHGTTHDFNEFDSTLGSKAGYWGAMNYFTTDYMDADQNYGHAEAPDLKNRVTFLAEELENNEFEGDATEEATRQLVGDDPKVLEVYVKLNNPFVIGGSSTFLSFSDPESFRSDAEESIATSYGEKVTDEFRQEREDEIQDEIYNLQIQEENPLTEAITSVAYDYNLDYTSLIGDIVDYSDDISSYQLIKELRKNINDMSGGVPYDSNGEPVSSGEIVNKIIEELGYDGIVMRDADEFFPNMDIGANTTHVHVFHENRSSIKSIEGNDTYDSSSPNIYKSKKPRFQAPRDSMGMYSALEEALINLPQEKGTWGQIRGMLKKDGVTDEELEWSTIKDKLRDPSDKVTKSGLLDDLLGVSEEDFDVNSPEFIDQQRVMYAKFDEVIMNEGRDGDQYASWTLPMGNTKAGRVTGLNYRMVAYKVPNPPWAFFGERDFRDAGLEDTYINDLASLALFGKPAEEVLSEKVSGEALAEGDSIVNPTSPIVSRQARINLKLGANSDIAAKKTFDPQEPPEGHFGSDTLMHYRATDRYTKDGKKILMVEELQSDWIQEGFKEGVGFIPNIPSIIAKNREAGKDFQSSYGTDSEGNIKNWVYNPRGIKKKKGESAESLQKRKDAHLEEVKSIILKLRGEYLPKKEAYDLKVAEAKANIERYLTTDFNMRNPEDGGTLDTKNLEGLGVVSLEDMHRMRDGIRRQNPRELGRELRDIINYYKAGNRSARSASVPDAPYKQKWTEFLMKRIMKKAHDEGYDGVGWTTGDQQNERYKLSQFVSALGYEKIDVDTWRLTGVYSKKQMEVSGEDGTFIKEVDDDDLENTVGSELADRIRDGDSEDSLVVIASRGGTKRIVIDSTPLSHDAPLPNYLDVERIEEIFDKHSGYYQNKRYQFSDVLKNRRSTEDSGLEAGTTGHTLFAEIRELLSSYGAFDISDSPDYGYMYSTTARNSIGKLKQLSEALESRGNTVFPEIPTIFSALHPDISKDSFHKEVKEVGKRIGVMLEDLDSMWSKGEFALYESEGVEFKTVYPANLIGTRFKNDYLQTPVTIQALKGEDMEVGGERKKNFYDRKLVNQVNAYAKKRNWGAKRETLTLTDSTEYIGRVIGKDIFQGYDVAVNPEFGDGGNYNMIVDPEGNRVGDVSFTYMGQAFEYIAEMLDLDITRPQIDSYISEASSPDDTISNQTTEVHGLMFTDDAHRDLELRGVPKFSKAYPEGGGDQINTLNLGQDSNGEEVIVTTTNPMMTKDSKPSAFYKEWFTKEGGLGEQAFARNIEAMGMKNRDEVEIEFLHAALENVVKSEYKGKPEIRDLHPAVKTQFNNYINGDTVTPFPPIPDKVKEPLNMMRASLDRMSVKMQEIVGEELSLIVNKQNNEDRIASLDYVRAIVDGEISTPELEEGVPDSVIAKVALFTTIQGNLGKYINRSYRVFDDETWADKVRENKPVMDAARKAIAIRLGGGQADMAEDLLKMASFNNEIDGQINNILNPNHSSLSGVLMSEVGRKDLSIWRKRKDIEPEILALMGEYEDVGVNYSRSVHKMSYLYANHHFLKSVREDGLKEGGFLSTKRTGRAYKLIAPVGSNEMTPLAGLYAPPEFVQALNEAVAPKVLNDMVAQLRKLNSMVKVGKTIYSPTTQARNLISAFGFTVLSGHFNYTHGINAAKHTLADLRTHDAASQAYLEKLVSMGVLHDNPRASELKDALEEVGLDSGNVIVEGKTKTTRFAKTTHKQLVKLYRAGDDLWKIIGFENEKEAFINSGMSVEKAEKKAAERIRNGYPTYSMVPKAIKALRRNPFVGTFVSFPWEIGRTAYNNGKFMFEDAREGRTLQASRRLVGMLLAGSVPTALSIFSMEMFGLDEKDEDAVRHLAPEWQRNAILLFTGYDEHGNIQYLDLSHLDPYTIIKKPLIALFNDNNEGAFERVGDALKELYSPFLGAEMGFKGLVDIAVNKKDSGAPVYGEHDASIASRTADSAEHIFNTLAPSVTHNAEKLIKAGLFEFITDWGIEKKSKSSKKLVLWDEFRALGGFRFSTLDAARSLTYQAFDYQRASSDASHGVYSVMGNPNIGQYENIESAVLYAQRQLDSQWKIMESHLRAAKITGLTRQEIIKSLRAGGMPKYKVADLLRGRTPAFRVNKSSLKSSLGRATRDTEGEEKKESRAEWFKRKKELLRTTRELRAEKKLGKFPVKAAVH